MKRNRKKSNRKKKVLMLASVASMIDQFNMANIRLLLEMGYEVHVACNFLAGNTCSKERIQKLQQTLDKWHVVWHQWDCPRSIRPVSKCAAAFKQLQILLRVHRFAWMHCHSPVGGALARIAAHQEGARVIYTAHGFHFFRGAPVWNWLLYYPAERLLSCWSDVLIAINREDYLLAKNRLYAKKLFYLPGVGVDTLRFQQQGGVAVRREYRRKYGISQNAVLLLSVGELSSRKNHQAVLDALANMGGRTCYYLICGQGALKDDLQKQAEALGIAGRVRMPGFLEDLAGIYHAADLFVFPSRQEGLPAALMEAMAAGLACVASDIRGNRELLGTAGQAKGAGTKKQACVQPGGILYAADSRKQLVCALEYMLEHPQYRASCAKYNQQRIWGYDIQAVQRRMRCIYQQMEQDGK
ncbi:MAG: glycosyltransferase [Eubacterium sp.]|nr:glycosyltransferase [Eubacterium sp.]